MKYSAIYKCLLCGQLLRYGESQEVPYNKLSELLEKVIQNQLFSGNSALHTAPMHIPHECKNGNAGLAYFSGFMKENDQ